MDINAHVDSIVQGIVAEITTKVEAQVAEAIAQRVNQVVSEMDHTEILREKLGQQLELKLSQLNIDRTSIESLRVKK